MLTYDLDTKNKYWSLYSYIRDDILCGRIKCGEKLPSKRSLAENLSVSVITVQNAYDQLLAEGYVRSEERSGYFVEEVNAAFYGKREFLFEQKAEGKKLAIDFVKGSVPAGLFPFSTWARLMRKVLSDCGEHLLESVPCDGDRELKRALADYLYRARGISVDPRFIVIGAGAEYLYGVIVNLLGRDKVFAVENPGYNKISANYTLNGAKCVYIPVTESGISCEGVEKSGADVVHVSPSHQYPTGAVMPASARSRLISWANGGGYVIED
ncbi:MAG: PLP-dependent aminotransferase family protein, partial [Clostridia bacterium]|nr:PLP-dependent aminotransferase family protein [Clostridia bacterium]